jgi:monofunctional biosynthetic peptidoglycan transglycosylase
MLKKIQFVVPALSLALAVFSAFFLFHPGIDRLARENPGKTAFMKYREAEWNRNGRDVHIQQKWVPLRRISPYIVQAVIISEDGKFWHHSGFDFDAMQKAFEKNIRAGRWKYGGSTISQQLVKNLYLSPSKNPVRKIREAILTWRIERNLSKRRILELYLNIVEWGDGIFGIEAASRRYFGKPSSELTPMEAATLVAVLPNPTRYRADRPSRYIQKKANFIYRVMVRKGVVIAETASTP